MPKTYPKNSVQAGFQLIEIIIASAILLILSHALFTLITASYQLLSLSRIQTTARAIANEQIELIRNLPYDSIGTQGGIPSGSIAQTKNITANGQNFAISTFISYIDDPFDGIAPTDIAPTDYKRAKVTVSWIGTPTQEMISLITDISPGSVEADIDGGTIRILVYDAQGQPVPQANVSIEAPSAIPPVDLDLVTDNSGTILLQGAPACTACYNISVTKENYSSDRTYSINEIANPDQPPLTVLNNQISQISFGIDTLSTITFNSFFDRTQGFSTAGNTTIHLTSSKTIGTDNTGEPVYKFDQDFTTDSGGALTLDLEWGTYALEADNSNYSIAGSYPTTPITVFPNQPDDVNFAISNFSDYSLLVAVKDASGSAVPNADIHVTGPDYEQTISSGNTGDPDFGQAFFSALTPQTYNIQVTHPSLQEATGSADITGTDQQIIILNQPN